MFARGGRSGTGGDERVAPGMGRRSPWSHSGQGGIVEPLETCRTTRLIRRLPLACGLTTTSGPAGSADRSKDSTLSGVVGVS